MRKLKQQRLPLFFALGFTVLAIGLFRIYKERRAEAPVFAVSAPEPVPAPVALPSQVSPDGTHTVALRVKGDVTEILVNDQVVTTQQLGGNGALLLPLNTWSPDDKYFFVENKTETGEKYLVFSATGKAFADDSAYLVASDLFGEHYPDYTITEATGWAAPTLLILNTKDSDGRPTSFWFDVPSRKFIRLSSYFN